MLKKKKSSGSKKIRQGRNLDLRKEMKGAGEEINDRIKCFSLFFIDLKGNSLFKALIVIMYWMVKHINKQINDNNVTKGQKGGIENSLL